MFKSFLFIYTPAMLEIFLKQWDSSNLVFYFVDHFFFVNCFNYRRNWNIENKPLENMNKNWTVYSLEMIRWQIWGHFFISFILCRTLYFVVLLVKKINMYDYNFCVQFLYHYFHIIFGLNKLILLQNYTNYFCMSNTCIIKVFKTVKSFLNCQGFQGSFAG